MANSKQLQYDEFIKYVNGENLSKYVDMLTPDDIDKFTSLNIDTSKSYIIKSDDINKLRKFQVYFLLKVIRKRPAYKTYLLTEYAQGILGDDEEDFMLGSERELLFLLVHNQLMGVGNTELLYSGLVLEKVALRKLKGFSTVVLSMRELPELETSKEFEIINLGSFVTSNTYGVIDKKMKENNKEKLELIDKKIELNKSFKKSKASKDSSSNDDFNWGENIKNKDK